MRSVANLASCWWQFFHNPRSWKKTSAPKPVRGVREQIAERIELLLNAQRRALLLLQAIAQDVKFVLEIGIGLFQARTILEQLHEALFVSAHATALRPSLEKAELVDQMSRLEPMDQSRDTRGNLPTRSDGLARRSIPAIYLTACYGSSADPVHA